MSCVIVAFGGAVPLMTTVSDVLVEPSLGAVITRPIAGEGVAVGSGASVGGKVAGGTNVGEGVVSWVGVGVGVGAGVGVGDGAGLGDGVGAGLGDGVGVGLGVEVGAGVSWTNTGSEESGVALGDVEGTLATSAGRVPKTLATMSSVIMVRPATSPPSSQSRRGRVFCGRRETPP